MLIKPSEVVKVQDLGEYLKIKDQLKMFTFNDKILYINKQYDFFLVGGNNYFVSERFKNHIEKQSLEVTFFELSPASNIRAIVVSEEGV